MNRVSLLFSKRHLLTTFLLLFFLIYGVYRFAIVFSFEPELTNGESNNIWNAVNVSHGKQLYSNPEVLPLEVYQYTPLAQLPIIGLASILDDSSPDYIYKITFFGRLITFTYNIIAFIFLFLSCYRFLRMGVSFSLLTSISSFVLLTPTAFTIRPDALSLLFILSTLYFILDFLHYQRSFRRLIFIACWIALSFFVKQDTVFLIFPIGLFFILTKQWKNIVVFGLSFCLFLGVLLLLFDSYFGAYFLYSITKGIQNNPSLRQIIGVFDRSFGFFAVHFILGNTLLVFFLIKEFKFRNSQLYLLLLFCLLYEMLAVLATSKLGSWCNYYTPFVILSTVLIVYFLRKQYLSMSSNLAFKNAVFLGFGLLLTVFLFKQIYFYTSTFLHYSASKANYNSSYTLSQRIKNQLGLLPDQHIILLNRLSKNFLATNTVMVNTEYYPISNFNYSSFCNELKKPIDFVAFESSDKPVIMYLFSKFQLNMNEYEEIEGIGDYTVWKKNQ
jgi:hypothetical protein